MKVHSREAMEDLCTKWNNRNMTTEEEDEVVAVEEDTLAVGMEEVKSLLLGKLLTDKNYNKRALKNVIGNIWNVK